jgi:hypothetical protein
MTVITRRIGNFQPFARSTERDDGTSVGAQYGCVTYDKDDNYRISHVEIGFRCDHVYDTVGQQVSERKFDAPSSYDVDLMRRRDDVKKVQDDLTSNPPSPTE